MKRAFASIAGLVGLAALGRWLAKRRHPAPGPDEPVEATPADMVSADVVPGDPAEALRRRLSDAREAEPDAAHASEPPEETLAERRARVHAKAREAIDSMDTDSIDTDSMGDGDTPA